MNPLRLRIPPEMMSQMLDCAAPEYWRDVAFMAIEDRLKTRRKIQLGVILDIYDAKPVGMKRGRVHAHRRSVARANRVDAPTVDRIWQRASFRKVLDEYRPEREGDDGRFE